MTHLPQGGGTEDARMSKTDSVRLAIEDAIAAARGERDQRPGYIDSKTYPYRCEYVQQALEGALRSLAELEGNE